jgi:uncharacterized protein
MHFFFIPTIKCNSSCSYCYGDKNGNFIMQKETLSDAISFINRFSKEQDNSKTQITFHGGEPLLAAYDFYHFAIPYIKETLGYEATISIQSNLWLLNESLCQFFKNFHVGIGTSLDGPQEINDKQRSVGYFNKTFSGIEMLRKRGLSCGCIATFTKSSSEKIEEVFDFFHAKGLNFDVHSAIKPLGYSHDESLFISPDEFGELLINLLELYLKNLTKLKIGTLDTLIKNVANKKSGLCTFSKCLGEYFAISPEGDLYTCNRFVGIKDFCIGNIKDIHSFSDITNSVAWQKQQAWQDWIDAECKECLFKEFCHGGCPYAAFASGNGSFRKDPMCEAYKMIYSYIIDKGAAEFFSDEHLATLNQTQHLNNEVSFQSNPVLYLMSNKPHPVDLLQTSKKIITAALLGKSSNPKQTAEKLHELGIINSIEEKLPIIVSFYGELTQPSQGFNNLYLHITTNCNLSCSHCYSFEGNEIKNGNLSAEIIMNMIAEATFLSFRKIVFTGGEPLLHPDFEKLLDHLHQSKVKSNHPIFVLRTNLSSQLTPSIVEKIKSVFDQIIISIDGSEETHDRQRGKGAYQKTINNLAFFDAKTIEKKISFACTFDQHSSSVTESGKIKDQVYALKTQYPVKDIRFLPILPLGRVRHFKTQRNDAEMISVSEWMNRKYYFRTSCGLGQSVMIESNGDVYPCHVLKETQKQIMGNIYETDLSAIIQNTNFSQLRNINVNTNDKCKNCDLRYLCGGVCEIWKNQDCSDLYSRAKYLLNDALQICNISTKISG